MTLAGDWLPMASLKTPSLRTVERTVAVLEQLARSRSGLSLADLARQLGAPKSSLHGVLLTLERLEYVHRNRRTGRYALGLKLFPITDAALGVKLREQAAPILYPLAERTRLTVHLAILQQSEVVLVDKIVSARHESPAPATWVGKRMAAHCTAIGKALAAGLSEEALAALIRRRPLVRHNDNTVASPRRFRDELVRVRRLGYALEDQEEELGQRCIGVPIRDTEGRTAAALSVSGSVEELSADAIPLLVEELRAAAAAISRVLPPAEGDGER
jgi:DNA-binding IclR family transcriptional regulator